MVMNEQLGSSVWLNHDYSVMTWINIIDLTIKWLQNGSKSNIHD
jgi:hypothetical protein